jgi:hypothetical protein
MRVPQLHPLFMGPDPLPSPEELVLHTQFKIFLCTKDRFLFNLKSTGGEDLILFYALFRIYLGALHLHPAPQVPKQGFFFFFFNFILNESETFINLSKTGTNHHQRCTHNNTINVHKFRRKKIKINIYIYIYIYISFLFLMIKTWSAE